MLSFAKLRNLMILMFIKIAIFSSLLFIASCTNTPPLEIARYYQAETNKPYADVLAELSIAISEQNFRITGHSHVGEVIRQRGTKNFPDYDTIQFCNLTLAKMILQLSPHTIRHMPCNVVTYSFAGKTIVKTRLLPIDTENPLLNQFSKTMNQKLKQIVDFTVEE